MFVCYCVHQIPRDIPRNKAHSDEDPPDWRCVMLVTGGEDVCQGSCHEPSFYHAESVLGSFGRPAAMLLQVMGSLG